MLRPPFLLKTGEVSEAMLSIFVQRSKAVFILE